MNTYHVLYKRVKTSGLPAIPQEVRAMSIRSAIEQIEDVMPIGSDQELMGEIIYIIKVETHG